LMSERLTATLAPGTADAEQVATQVRALGYEISPLAAGEEPAHHHGAGSTHQHDDGHDHEGHDHGEAPAPVGAPAAHGHDHDAPADAGKPWYAPAKARLVWLLGGLVVGAYALSLALPHGFTYPLFLAATLVALIPFGRRAFALARAGSPFSIETLM